MSDRNKQELLSMMQQFVAVVSVGPSAMRNQGKGILLIVQNRLCVINLDDMPEKSEPFKDWLDVQTIILLSAIKKAAKGHPWGTARKALNLFLRNCFYHHYLRKAHNLSSIEKWLEVPLDSIVSSALKKDAGRGKLPPWPGLKNLTPSSSKQFQDYAQLLADSYGLPARIHLDLYLWLSNR